MAESRGIAQSGIGAHAAASGMSYRVWAPGQRALAAVIERGGAARRLPLAPEADGYWSATDAAGRPGDLYRFQLGDGPLLPDVASRFQPEGVDGRSECIDPGAYAWECSTWQRPGWRGQTTYEIHVGTLTPEGTFRAAIAKLDKVRELGAEAIEIMPVADFAGDRNWGYDGAALYAPARCYGRPDDLRALVDAAHARGLAAILDVVYNHVGPQGNYLHAYAPEYFRSDRDTPWGRAFNLDGRDSAPVREFLLGNAAYWLDEFRFDGLRLDATHAIPDSSAPHLLEEMADTAHARGAFLVAEDDRNSAELLRGGLGLDAAWADDFHHQVRVALTGTRKTYFAAYRGTPGDIAQTIEQGWTYRGQPYPPWEGRPRGTSSRGLPTTAFVYCIENHDQVGNRALGERLEQLVSPAQFRAASLLLCLNPCPILLFMGQEWAASTPFLFFSDHRGELGGKVSEGRRREFGHGAAGEDGPPVPDPEDPASFERSKLRWEERREGVHAATLELYRQCLRERRYVLGASAFERGRWSAHFAGPFVAVRYRLRDGERMLLVALGEGTLSPLTLPATLQPPADSTWRVVLDSESRRFGGPKDDPADRHWSLRGPGALWLEERVKGVPDATD